MSVLGGAAGFSCCQKGFYWCSPLQVVILKLLCYNSRRTAGYHLLIVLSGQLNQLK